MFAPIAPRKHGAASFVCVWCFLCCALCCVLYSLLMPNNTNTAAAQTIPAAALFNGWTLSGCGGRPDGLEVSRFSNRRLGMATRVECGRFVLIGFDSTAHVECYRTNDDGLELFVGYLHQGTSNAADRCRGIWSRACSYLT